MPPLKSFKKRKSKILSKPWLTKGLLISIRKKQLMYNNQFLHGSEMEKMLYKNYASQLTKLKVL